MAKPLIIPCPNRVPCAGVDTPFSNLTAEAPDSEIFIGRNFGNGDTPPIGDGFQNPTGFCFTQSIISQLDADQNAQQCQVGNQVDSPPDGDGGHWTDPGGGDVPIFRNTAQSCTVFCPDGTPFTYTVAAGRYSATNQAQANEIAASYACILANSNKICLSTLAPGACVGTIYSSFITASGPGPFTFFVSSGALPPGLTLSAIGNTANVVGVPTLAGLFTFSITATNASGASQIRTFTITVLQINTVSLANATVGAAYSQQIGVIGSAGPFTFTITFGSLPDGLSMSTTGLITGTPTTAQTSSFTVQATDGSAICSKDFSITSVNLFGWKICQWDTIVKPLFLDFTACAASATPAWNGVFDHVSTGGVNNNPFWYFLSQSVNGFAVAADADPLYLTPNWEDNVCCFQLYFFGGGWHLFMSCANCSLLWNTLWSGTGSSVNPNDPSGTYTQDGGTVVGLDKISVEANSATCCPDPGIIVPANFNPASPARVRIQSYSASIFGNCPGCAPSAAPAWDGTFQLKCTTGPANLKYLNAGGDCAETILLNPLSIGGFMIQSGVFGDVTHRIQLVFHTNDRWTVEIFCLPPVGPQVCIWGGSKLVGDTPQGTYIRGGTAFSPGVAAGPACLTIESY